MIKQSKYDPDKVMNYRKDSLFVGDSFSSSVQEILSEKNVETNLFVHNVCDSLDGEYDVITCMETIDHLTDPEAAARNLPGSLSSKGVLVLTVPGGRIDHCKNHTHFWSPESWEIFVNKLGQGVQYTHG